MASVPEERIAFIEQKIPELITSLSGFNESSENFKRCENFAWAMIRNHRFLSINSHEVKRNMDGVLEKFKLSNFEDVSNKLQASYEHVCNAPVCVGHYEVDAQFSIICVLLELAYKPMQVFKNKIQAGESIYLDDNVLSVVHKNNDETSELINFLRQDFVVPSQDDNDSVLSDWSESESEESTKKESFEELENQKDSSFTTTISNMRIEPPKPIIYKAFQSENPEKWLNENIQHSWWINGIQSNETFSYNESANFCETWNSHISKVSHNLVKPEQIVTVSEYCLLREVIWMFLAPTNCKFFRIEDGVVIMNFNVSLASVTARSLRAFMYNLTEHMTIMMKLKNEIMTKAENHTHQSYLKALDDILESSIVEFLLSQEKVVAAQLSHEVITILDLINGIQPYFELLKLLYEIHQAICLPKRKHPAHIYASFLLSGLLQIIKETSCKKKKNLAIVFYVASLKPYLMIIDTWWTEGRLDELKNEFLIEKVFKGEYQLPNGYSQRLLVKSREKSFFLHDTISSLIKRDDMVKLLVEYSMKAGYTLQILNNMDRTYNMRVQEQQNENDLFEEFEMLFLKRMEQYTENKLVNVTPHHQLSSRTEPSDQPMSSSNISSSLLDIGEELLLLVFGATFDDGAVKSKPKKIESDIYEMYKRLNYSSQILLPADVCFQTTITSLLESKISVADKFLMRIYNEELHVLQHLRNIRKVMLLESSDLMHTFYTNLFKQIESSDESRESWNNHYLLTVQLSDAIYPRYRDMSSMFSVQVLAVKCETSIVLEAIDRLVLSYRLNQDLSIVISPQMLINYNSILRFLLKIKWGLWTLENLRFPDVYKKRPPYAPLEIIDIVVRRLALTRFWMLYSIQSIHNHLMMQVLMNLGNQFDKKIIKSQNISEMVHIHESFISTILDHSFQMESGQKIMQCIIEMLKLIYVLRDEWKNVQIIGKLDERGDIEDSDVLSELNEQANLIEKSYINCHVQLAEILNAEVYKNNKVHLTGLNESINSIPY